MAKQLQLNIYFVLLLLGLLPLVACSPDAPLVEGVSTDISITYHREGSFAGITQEWIIFPDGRVVGPGGQELQVPPEQVIALLAKSREYESSSLQESYIQDDAWCDQFIYTITFKVGDEETKIHTSDGADHPVLVSSLLTDIEDLISMTEPVE